MLSRSTAGISGTLSLIQTRSSNCYMNSKWSLPCLSLSMKLVWRASSHSQAQILLLDFPQFLFPRLFEGSARSKNWNGSSPGASYSPTANRTRRASVDPLIFTRRILDRPYRTFYVPSVLGLEQHSEVSCIYLIFRSGIIVRIAYRDGMTLDSRPRRSCGGRFLKSLAWNLGPRFIRSVIERLDHRFDLLAPRNYGH